MDFLMKFADITSWYKIGISLIIFLFFMGIRKVFTTYIFKFFLKRAQRRSVAITANLLVAFEKPIRWLIVLIGIIIAVKYLPFNIVSNEMETKLFRSCFIILAFWGLLNVSSIVSLLFPHVIRKMNLEVDQIIMPFIKKVLNILLIALGTSIFLEEWGFNVNGFVAGLGLGGLAFALAAKDTVSNLFGGIVIITEKPFTIGDWIKTPSVEGTVEDITFRSTKIRTFAQALVTVPNSTLSNEPIINWSKMGKRQIAFHLGISYTTPKEKLEKLIVLIEKTLESHEDVHQETTLVKFDQFTNTSFDIYLYFFTISTDYVSYMRIKEEINFSILEILEKEEIQIAIPAQTLIFKNDSAFEEVNHFEPIKENE